MRNVIAVLFAAGLVTGCAGGSSSKTDFPMQEVATFVPGTTTKADVTARLGKPGAVDVMSFGEMWTYAQTDADISGFVVKTAKMRQKTAHISFQGDKLLTASWQITNTETGLGGGGTRITEADIAALRQQGTVTQTVVRQRFGEPQQTMWHLDGKQQWGYIVVGFAGSDPKYNRFDFDADGTLSKVALLER